MYFSRSHNEGLQLIPQRELCISPCTRLSLHLFCCLIPFGISLFIDLCRLQEIIYFNNYSKNYRKDIVMQILVAILTLKTKLLAFLRFLMWLLSLVHPEAKTLINTSLR